MNPFKRTHARKALSLLMVAIQLHSQVVFAGMPTMAMTFPNLNLYSHISSLAKKYWAPAALLVFKSFPYADTINPRGQTDVPDEGRIPEDQAKEKDDRQKNFLKQMEELQIFQ